MPPVGGLLFFQAETKFAAAHFSPIEGWGSGGADALILESQQESVSLSF
jgi:hypothetical protein